MPATKFDSIDLDQYPAGPVVYHFYSAGAQTASAKKNGFICPAAGVVKDIRAYADTAPITTSLIIDVNKNGTTLFTTQASRPTIAAAGNASSATLPDVTAVAAGDRITYDIDQIGSGGAGSDLYLSITIAHNGYDRV